MQLRMLSAGAAQGLVTALSDELRIAAGCEIAATFGAVGAIKARFVEGEAADVVILSHAVVGELVREGILVAGSEADIGVVHTGLAVCEGNTVPDVSTASALRDALCAADAIFIPDPSSATAGLHFAEVIRKLGIEGELAGRVRSYANGHAAMTAMAVQCGVRSIGCTQVTEIFAVPGVKLAGLLPHELELRTMYTAAVARVAAQPEAALRAIEILTGESVAPLRERLGLSEV